MLETFREYGREQLLEQRRGGGDRASARGVHARPRRGRTLEMSPAEREAWLRSCDVEHDNFRAAIHCLITTGDRGMGAPARCGAVQVLGAAGPSHRGTRDAGAECSPCPGPRRRRALRARALYCASVLADIQADLDTAEMLSREACDIYRQFDDTQGIATTMIVDGLPGAAAGPIRGGHLAVRRNRRRCGSSSATRPRWISRRATWRHAAKARREFRPRRAASSKQVVASSAGAWRSCAAYAFALNGLGDVAASQGRP